MNHGRVLPRPVLSAVLTLLLVLPMLFCSAPLGAESAVPAWDAAAYEDMPEVDDALLEKFLKSLAQSNLVAEGDFKLAAVMTYEAGDTSTEQTVEIDSTFYAEIKEDLTNAFRLHADMHVDGGDNTIDGEVYTVEDPEDADQFLNYAVIRLQFGGEPEIYTELRKIARKEMETLVERFTSSADAAEKFKSAGTMKLREDKGDTVDAVILLPVKNLFESLAESMNQPENELQVIDAEAAVKEMDAFSEERGIKEFVLPIEINFDKDNGMPYSLHLVTDGLREFFNRIEENDGGGLGFRIALNALEVGVFRIAREEQPIRVPDDVIAAAEAGRAAAAEITEEAPAEAESAEAAG